MKKGKPATDDRFDRSLNFTLRWEGGYVFDPQDPGGETRFGISKRAYPNLDIKKLTRDQAAGIYHRDYWIASGAGGFGWPACLAIFDVAVNCGVKKALDFTGTAIGSWSGHEALDPDTLALKICAGRMRFYRRLVAQKPVMQKFLKGWTNRLDALRREALKKF